MVHRKRRSTGYNQMVQPTTAAAPPRAGSTQPAQQCMHTACTAASYAPKTQTLNPEPRKHVIAGHLSTLEFHQLRLAVERFGVLSAKAQVTRCMWNTFSSSMQTSRVCSEGDAIPSTIQAAFGGAFHQTLNPAGECVLTDRSQEVAGAAAAIALTGAVQEKLAACTVQWQETMHLRAETAPRVGLCCWSPVPANTFAPDLACMWNCLYSPKKKLPGKAHVLQQHRYFSRIITPTLETVHACNLLPGRRTWQLLSRISTAW